MFVRVCVELCRKTARKALCETLTRKSGDVVVVDYVVVGNGYGRLLSQAYFYRCFVLQSVCLWQNLVDIY